MEILKTDKLTFAYIKQPLLLYNINLNLKGGGVFWLFGSPLSGKTTLLEILCGMQTMYMGSVFVCGDTPKNSTKNISYLPGKVVAKNNKTVEDNLLFACKMAEKDSTKIDKEDKIISQIYKTKIKKLSALQKQIFALKRAQIKDAKLLLIDVDLTGFSADDVKIYASYLKEIFKNAQNKQIIVAISPKDYKKLQIEVDNAKYGYLFGQLSVYNSLQEYKNNLCYLGMAEYLDYIKYEGEVISTINGYMLNVNETTIKLDDNWLTAIKPYFEDYSSCKVAVFSKNNLKKQSGSEILKQIKTEEVLLFDVLSGERLK